MPISIDMQNGKVTAKTTNPILSFILKIREKKTQKAR
jgi:hypothetical protein